MNIKKLCLLLALASTFALGTAIAQESDDPSAAEGAATERQRPDSRQQRPDSNQQRQRRGNMSDEQRAAARERWQGMSDSERQAARDKRGARGNAPELGRVTTEAKAIQELPYDEGNLGSLSPPIGVDLVHHQREYLVGVGGEPIACLVEYRVLEFAHQHHIQHRVVRNEDVGWVGNHVPPREHLAKSRVGKLGKQLLLGESPESLGIDAVSELVSLLLNLA